MNLLSSTGCAWVGDRPRSIRFFMLFQESFDLRCSKSLGKSTWTFVVPTPCMFPDSCGSGLASFRLTTTNISAFPDIPHLFPKHFSLPTKYPQQTSQNQADSESSPAPTTRDCSRPLRQALNAAPQWLRRAETWDRGALDLFETKCVYFPDIASSQVQQPQSNGSSASAGRTGRCSASSASPKAYIADLRRTCKLQANAPRSRVSQCLVTCSPGILK